MTERNGGDGGWSREWRKRWR